MRQAATAVIVCLCFALASPARGGDGATVSVAGTIGRARRLIDAKDYAAAVTLLEDTVLESGPAERPVILGILKQSYEVMAKEAEAAGRDRQAAHYRDNLAILSASPRVREPARPTAPSARPKQLPRSAESSPDDSQPKPADQPKPVTPKTSNPPPKTTTSAPLLEPPAALSEPPVMPRPAPAPAQRAGSGANFAPQAISDPEAPAPKRDDASAALVEEPGQSFAAPAPAPSRGAASTARALSQPPAEVRAPEGTSQIEADRLFSAKKYKEAGRCYAALARENRLPATRTNHWAYCRIVDVASRMNARPQTAREWDEIEAEIQSIQKLAPNLWYGEYLRDRLADVRKGRSRAKAQIDKLVVRGSAPDESPGQARRFPRLFGNLRADAPPKAAGAPPSAASQPEAKAPERPPTLAGDRAGTIHR